MFGCVAYREHGGGAPPVRMLGGVRFRMAYVERGEGFRARRSARRAARALARAGTGEALFPADYPLRAEFARYGVRAVSTAPLHAATAAAIIRRALQRYGVAPASATVAFAARFCSRELARAALETAAEVRYIELALGSGGEELALRLRRDCGVAARLLPPKEHSRAALTVCFDDAAAAGGPVLPLWDEALAVAYAPPEGFDAGPYAPEALLAALCRTGALDAGTLRVEDVALL